MTVDGPVLSQKLGITLVHEHIVSDFSCLMEEPEEATLKQLFHSPVTMENLGEVKWTPLACKDNYQLHDIKVAIQEVMYFKMAGGGTIVDTTPWELGRDPLALKRIARITGLNIVMGCGYYIQAAYSKQLNEQGIESITNRIVEEFTNGVGGTGVRPGVIGEIGTSSPITPSEEHSLRASARAQVLLGAPFTIHLSPWDKEGERVLDIVESENVKLHRVILDHLSPTAPDIEYHDRLAKRGSYLGYDLFGFDHSLIKKGKWIFADWETVESIKEMIDRGHVSRILVSQDVAVKTRLVKYGGWGYAHILEHVIPLFREHGIGEKDIETILIDNPRRILEWEANA